MSVANLIDLVTQFGPFGFAIGAVLYAFLNPEKTERVAGWFGGLFSWTGRKATRFAVKNRIQGTINDFARSSNREVNGAMPHNMKLDFIEDIERAEFDLPTQTVIVRIRDRVDDDRNLVHAMLVFSPTGVLPQARAYLPKSLNRAIDVVVTRKLLSALKHHSAIQYLHDTVLPSLWKDDPDSKALTEQLSLLDEQGLFSRVVMTELRDFGASVLTTLPSEDHFKEALEFVSYVHQVATRQSGQDLLRPGVRGLYCKTAFVFVTRVASEDTIKRHIDWLRENGYTRLYLAARGGADGEGENQRDSANIDLANAISAAAEAGGIARVQRRMTYGAHDPYGNVRKHMLIEMSVTGNSS